MNSTEIFALALNLQEPWYIKDIKLQKPEQIKRGQLDIYIDFRQGAKFSDEHGKLCSVYDTEQRSWQHLNFFEHNCYLHARVPRINQSDGTVKTIVVPWARSGSGFTLLFEAFAMLLIEYEMPVNKVASTLRVVAHRLWRVFNFWVKDARQQDSLAEVKQIGIDETSAKKGHDYVTVCADLEKRRVIHVSEGREATVVADLVNAIEEKEGDVKAVSHVAIDMSPAYISGVTEHLPNAKIVFDKFHITAMLNKAMDELRKGERKEFEMLKGHKYTVLYRYENLTAKKQDELDYMLMAFPRLGEGYRLKELFATFWELNNTEEALSFLTYWCDIVMDTDIQPFKQFVKTIKAHWTGIINYVKAKINTGVMEGINNKIQLAKRRARGYRNKENFINMIYFIAGKLKFNYPYYPS
ncbi:ISL3-like element ISMac21 family transposase [soil metagenome]